MATTNEQDLTALRSEDRSTVIGAARRLESQRGIGLVLLRMLRGETRPMNRQAILYVLSWQGDIRAWWPFVKILSDVHETPSVRGQAAEGIAYMYHEKKRGSLSHGVATQVLAWALRDSSPEVRYYAVFALGKSLDRSLIEVLRGIAGDTGRAETIRGTVGEEALRAIDWLEQSTSNT